MPAKQPDLSSSEKGLLGALGERIRLARLRRRMAMLTVSARAGISRMTLYKAEKGDPSVALGTYVRILGVLRLAEDLNLVAADDRLGQRLRDLALPLRRKVQARKRDRE